MSEERKETNRKRPVLEEMVDKTYERFMGIDYVASQERPKDIYSVAEEVIRGSETDILGLVVKLMRQTTVSASDLPEFEGYKDWDELFIFIGTRIIDRELVKIHPDAEVEEERKFKEYRKHTGKDDYDI